MKRLALGLILCLPSCASAGLTRWAMSGPYTMNVTVATVRNSDGSTSAIQETRTHPAQMGKVMSLMFGIVPALAWDVVTFPAQLAMGYPPYGDRD